MLTLAPAIEPELSATRPLGPWANGLQMSPEEYERATEWDPFYRYELVNGVLVVSPPADIGERSPNDFLGYLLQSYKYSHPLGSHLDETAPEQSVRTSAGWRRMDRAIWAGFNRPIRDTRDVPTITVEYVSDTSRDRRRDFVQKRAEYAAIGVKEYWIIDRFNRSLTVIRGADVAVIGENQIHKTDLLPGFELPVGRLLAVADRLVEPPESSAFPE
ncbi:MAG: Uma2 family endonuclease [Planctomycetaceae bacterium]|nr:Uma2 family endonuclease [Planctomycetaceae bacterium]